MAAPSSSLLERIALRLLNSDGRQIGMATLISPTVAITAADIVENHQDYLLSDVDLIFDSRISASVFARDERRGFAALELNSPIADNLPEFTLNWHRARSTPPPLKSTWESLYLKDAVIERLSGEILWLEREGAGIRLSTFSEAAAFSSISEALGSPVILEQDWLVGVISQSLRGGFVLTPIVMMLDSVEGQRVAAAIESDLSSTRPAREDTPKRLDPGGADKSGGEMDISPSDKSGGEMDQIIPSDKSGGEMNASPSGKRRPSAPKFDREAFQARLSTSSLTALAHANGILRSHRQDKLHMEHLIAGLFQKNNGPTRNEFMRAGIDRDKLARIIAEQGGTRLPPENGYQLQELPVLPLLSKHVEQAFQAALTLADEQKSKAIRTRHLIRGALSVSDCKLIKALLDEGVSPERVPLDDSEIPPIPRRPTQAGIKSDDPEGEDLLDIKAEVEALCTVLAAKDVKPPISLGLFGDWGSGKSFFMKKMEARFKELSVVARKKGDSAFCENIVQLWFNAWHYMDTNLWASLATEIFDKLAQELARQDALDANIKDPDYERAQLIAQRATATEEVVNAERVKREADASLRASELQLANIQSGDAGGSPRPLDVLREGYRFAVQQPEVRKKVKAAEDALNQKVEKAAEALNIDRPVDLVKEQLLELQGIWGYLRAIVIAVREAKNKGRRLLWLLAILGVVAILLLVLPQVIQQEWLRSTWLRISGAVLVIVGAVAPFLPAVHRAVQIIHGAVKTNQESIEKARLEAEEKLQEEHEKLQDKAAKAQTELDEKISAAALVTRKLESLRADRQITDFIRQRQQSSDYTKYLGVIAKARNDFEQLSTLLSREQGRSAREREEQRKRKLQAIAGVQQATQTTDQGPLLPRIDRIILYIDDLDRCPEHKVVDVLQAVHLLLAFPLFIVVVGVDPRWLLHSLRQHSRTFREEMEDETASDEESSHWQATPLNYLEKIFQIPFTLWPMGKSGFGKMVDTLTEPPKPPEKTEESGQAKVELKGSDEAKTKAQAEQSEASPIESEVSTDKATLVPVEDVSWWNRLVAFVKRSLGLGQGPEAGQAAVESTSEGSAAPVPPATAEERAKESDDVDPEQLAGGHAGGDQTTSAIDPNPEHLQIEPWERAFMKELHQLIPSPRATKRFINIYRLIRAAVDLDEKLALEEFIGNEKQGKYQAALLLLAILTGYPDQATEILRELVESKHTETWWQFVDSFKGRAEMTQVPSARKNAGNGKRTVIGKSLAKKTESATKSVLELRGAAATGSHNRDGSADARAANVQRDAEAWAELLETLGNLRHIIEPTLPCDDFIEWAPKVARYSFQSGRVLLTRGANP